MSNLFFFWGTLGFVGSLGLLFRERCAAGVVAILTFTPEICGEAGWFMICDGWRDGWIQTAVADPRPRPCALAQFLALTGRRFLVLGFLQAVLI